MITVVGVKFKSAGKVYFFDPAGHDLKEGDDVIVQTARGLEFGTVSSAPRQVKKSDVVKPIKPVVRIANEDDQRKHEENLARRDEAMRICQEKINKHQIDMKLVDVEFTFDNNKIIFYFTADGRVDFRELVKDLATVFRMRIELRQIGVRDESKMLGGVGNCGRGLCCHEWMNDFHPVSIVHSSSLRQAVRVSMIRQSDLRCQLPSIRGSLIGFSSTDAANCAGSKRSLSPPIFAQPSPTSGLSAHISGSLTGWEHSFSSAWS